MMQYDQHRQYATWKQGEMMRQAEQYRLGSVARSGRKVLRLRFYDPALAQIGRWLVASGYRLQKRYGEWKEFAPPTPKPMPSKRRA
jgi:hypothetical protein